MRYPRPLPAELSHRPFETDEARDLGVTPKRLRAPDLARPFRGIRAAEHPQGVVDFARAYARRMPAGQHFSHSTAALLLGLPLPESVLGDPVLHVTAIAPARAPRMHGLIGHRTRLAVRVMEMLGLRVSDPVETWCAMAGSLGLRDLVILGDALVRRSRPLATIDDLQRGVAEASGRAGYLQMVRALSLVRARTDSPMETIIRLIILNFDLPEPDVNFTVLDARQRFVALADLAYPRYRVLIEYDGGHHFETEEQGHHDVDRLDRLDRLMEFKWRVVRLNKSHLARPAEIDRRVRTALMDAGWRR